MEKIIENKELFTKTQPLNGIIPRECPDSSYTVKEKSVAADVQKHSTDRVIEEVKIEKGSDVESVAVKIEGEQIHPTMEELINE